MKNVKHLIFDFDGTIGNSFNLAIETSNHYAKHFGYHVLEEKDIPIIKSMGPRELITHLGIRRRKLPLVARLGRRYMKDRADTIELYEGMGECIKKCHSEGKKLYVVSSSLPESIRKCLKHTGYDTYFIDIRGGGKIMGKTSMIKKLMKRHGIKKEEAVYIGDEVRDIMTCRPIDLPVISVSRGFNDLSLLQQHNETIVHTPQELCSLFHCGKK